MARLLIVAYDFPPSIAPGAARTWRFYRYLPEYGVETHVITAWQQPAGRERVTFVEPPPKGLLEKVLRKTLFPSDGEILWARPALAAAAELVRERRIDAVLSSVPPIHSHWIARRLKRAFGLQWIADYRDPIVGNPFRAASGLPGLTDRFLDRRFFSDADALISVSDVVAAEWRAAYPMYGPKIHVLWNGFDPGETLGPQPIPTRPYRELVHLGSLYGGRDPGLVLSALARLVANGRVNPASFRIRLVGDLSPLILARHERLFQELTAAGALEYLPHPLPRPDALEIGSRADYLLLLDNNAHNVGHTVPAKLFEYVRIGRPILVVTERQSPVERLLERSGVPFVALSNGASAEAADDALLRLLAMPPEPAPLSEDFQRAFDGRKQAGALADIILRLCAERVPDPVAGLHGAG